MVRAFAGRTMILRVAPSATLLCSLACRAPVDDPKLDLETDEEVDTDRVDVLPAHVRKNAKNLMSREKQVLVDAIVALKSAPAPTGIEAIVITNDMTIPVNSYYDMFIAFHQASVMWSVHQQDGAGVAHKNPSFPPWHRKLLRLYELALSEMAGETVALPYWDWTDEDSTRAVFSPDLMGSFGDPDCEPDCAYAVTDGAFRKGQWTLDMPTLMESYQGQHPWTWIVRARGVHDNVDYPVELPSAAQVSTAMTLDAYDASPWDNTVTRMDSFRNYLEGFDPPTDDQYMHNIGHDWVSGGWKVGEQVYVGTMEPLDISPSDPVFFLHHCNVDRIWASWQVYAEGRMDTYIPESGARNGWNRDDDMYPYVLFTDVEEIGTDIRPVDQLDFEALGFTYEAYVQ